MRLFNLEDIYNFHPFYSEFRVQNFDSYSRQAFFRNKDCLCLGITFIYKGGFVNPDDYIDTGISFKDATKFIDKPIISLDYIEIQKEKFKKQGNGSEILNWFVGICDKYDFKCVLKMDTQFGTPIDILEKFYSNVGFIRVDTHNMERPCKSDRDKNYGTYDLRERLDLMDNIDNLINSIYKINTESYYHDEREKDDSIKLYGNYTKYLSKDISECILVIKSSNDINYVTLYRLLCNLKYIVRQLIDSENKFVSQNDVNDIQEFIYIIMEYFE